jgi:hypothetical protein
MVMKSGVTDKNFIMQSKTVIKYHHDNVLWYKCSYINNKLHGYYEYHMVKGYGINISYYAR